MQVHKLTSTVRLGPCSPSHEQWGLLGKGVSHKRCLSGNKMKEENGPCPLRASSRKSDLWE